MADQIQSCAALVVGMQHHPGRVRGMRLFQHPVTLHGVVVPFVECGDIHR